MRVKCICVFFFKQKTAYEMRISDWSSDVCSSDLHLDEGEYVWRQHVPIAVRHGASEAKIDALAKGAITSKAFSPDERALLAYGAQVIRGGQVDRSEEHTSELQSLMRISYAVFCLKKKNNYHMHRKEKHSTIVM